MIICLCCTVAEVEETDQDETDSLEQPRITSTALKMQMTLRSMIDLGMLVQKSKFTDVLLITYISHFFAV